jgi:hypothetical protein
VEGIEGRDRAAAQEGASGSSSATATDDVSAPYAAEGIGRREWRAGGHAA